MKLLINNRGNPLEEFVLLRPLYVVMDTCGSTADHHAHIGNLRPYLCEDFLKRVLLLNGYVSESSRRVRPYHRRC